MSESIEGVGGRQRITISLAAGLKQQIEARASETHRSVSQYLRDLAHRDLKRKPHEQRNAE